MRRIAALTVSQPYASLIAGGEKWVENRRWYTSYRGPLAIHAGKGTQYLSPADLLGYPAGAVIAVADLVCCCQLERLQRELAEGIVISPKLRSRGVTDHLLRRVLTHQHTEGPYVWILRNVRKLPDPVPMSGKQGLWNVDDPAILEVAWKQTQGAPA